jgi:hypothetical protein
VGDAGAGEGLDAGGIGEDEVAAGQAAAVVVPEKRPIGGQTDDGHGGGPDRRGYRGVVQIEHDEVRTPAGREMLANVGPGVAEAQKDVCGFGVIESEAKAGVAGAGEVIGGESRCHRAEQVAAGHQQTPRSARTAVGRALPLLIRKLLFNRPWSRIVPQQHSDSDDPKTIAIFPPY